MRLDAFFDAIDDEDYKLARLIVKKAVRKFPRHPVCFALQGLAAVFIDNKLTDSVQYIPFPNDLNSHYQAYTCADMTKLKSAGYNEEPIPLKKGIESYLSANTKVLNN